MYTDIHLRPGLHDAKVLNTRVVISKTILILLQHTSRKKITRGLPHFLIFSPFIKILYNH